MGQNQNIRQRISLEGGETIRQQLQAIGAAGQKAFGDLQNAVQSNRAFGAIGAAIDSVKAKAAQLSGAGSQLGKDLGDLGGSATKVASIFGVTLAGSITGVVAGVAAMVKNSGAASTSLQNAADAAGTTTDKFQSLTAAAGKVNLDQDDVAKALTKINGLSNESVKKNLELQRSQSNLSRQFARGEITFESYMKSQRDLNEKAEQEIDIFHRLGVSATDTDGRVKDSVDLLKELADGLKDVPDAANRAGLALEITGVKNSKFNSLMLKGSEGIEAFERAAQRTAPKITPLQIAVGNNLTSAFKGLQSTIASTRETVLTLFAPNETRLVKAFQELIVANRDRLVDMASTIAQKVTPIVDDLIAVLQGRDADVKNNIILVLRDGIVSFGTEAKKAVTDIILPALAALLKVLDAVAQAINGLFGTKLSGTQIAVAIVLAKAIGIFGLFTAAIKVVLGAIGLLVTGLGAIPIAIAAVGFAIGFILVRALQGVPWAAFATAAANTWAAIMGGVRAVGDFIASALNGAAIAVSNAFATCVQFVTDLWNGLLAFFGGLPATVGAFFVSIGDAIKSAFFDAVNAVKSFIDDLWTKVTNIFNGIIAAARRVAQAVRAVVGGGEGGGEAGGNAPGFAGGGQFRGRPGRDTNLAWLTDKEFVMKVSAVKKWGVGFMHAINDGRNPFAGFNAGGLVDSLSSFGLGGFPRFADGGLNTVSALRPAIINFNGQQFAGQFTDDVLKDLAQASIKSRTRRAGKSPNWVGA